MPSCFPKIQSACLPDVEVIRGRGARDREERGKPRGFLYLSYFLLRGPASRLGAPRHLCSQLWLSSGSESSPISSSTICSNSIRALSAFTG